MASAHIWKQCSARALRRAALPKVLTELHSTAKTPRTRDTDADGLSDGVEVMGRRDAQPHQPLVLWGANRRHKDMFVEVDYQRRAVAEAGKKMRPEIGPLVPTRGSKASSRA